MTVEKEIPKRGFSEREAAVYIGRSVSYLRIARCNGPSVKNHRRNPGPKFRKKGKCVIYLKEDLDRWLEESEAHESAGHYTELD